jgi:transposase-like protein
MDWPSTRVEDVPPEEFVPEYCPRPHCPSHRNESPVGFDFTRLRSRYRRKCDGRWVPRFRCHACRHTFSQQTFAVTYYLKRPELVEPVARALVASSAHRQIARSQGCAASTVTRLAARLGRHAMLLTAKMIDELPSLEEPVCYDHFETFGVCQDFPIGVGTPITRDSRLLIGLDAAPHRRSGPLSDAQRERRAQREALHGRPKRGSYRDALSGTLSRLLRKVPETSELRITTDDKPDYRRAVRSHPEATRIGHRAYANPPRGAKGSARSTEARVRDRAMRPVDAAHQFIRHSQAHHRRETIAFARRHSALLERLFLHGAWLNLVKLRVENDPDSGSRAMAAGVTGERWDWRRIFARRLLPRQVDLPPEWRRIYFRRLPFPRGAERKPHAKKLAI